MPYFKNKPGNKMYEIFFEKDQQKKLDNCFEIYDASHVNRKDYRELSAFENFCKTGGWAHEGLSGLFSPRFYEKTAISGNQIKSFIDEHPAYDIYLFHPYPYELSLANLFLELAEHEHPGINIALKEVWINLYNSTLPALDAQTDKMLCCHCNYFVANSFFWRDYAIYVEKYMAYLKSPNSEMLKRKSTYTLNNANKDTVPMGVFVFERSLSHFLKFNENKYQVANYSYMTDYEPPELFNGEKSYVSKLLQYIYQKPSDNISSFRSDAIKQYYNHRKRKYKTY
jgi:hypothetical protein